jgi:hypothetical protein
MDRTKKIFHVSFVISQLPFVTRHLRSLEGQEGGTSTPAGLPACPALPPVIG